MRSLFLYNSILFLGLPFCDQKGSEKVSLLRGSALGGQNDGRHPAELARSCGSKPHWGFDRYATPQCKHPPLQRGGNPFKVIAAQHIYYSTFYMHLSILNMHK